MFILDHISRQKDLKTIGVFSKKEIAENLIPIYKKKPGFNRSKSGFKIIELKELDERVNYNSDEGFVVYLYNEEKEIVDEYVGFFYNEKNAKKFVQNSKYVYDEVICDKAWWEEGFFTYYK